MPYQAVAEVPESVPAEFRQQWLEVWNSVYAQAIKDGKNEKEAESMAFERANGVIAKREQQGINEGNLLAVRQAVALRDGGDGEGRVWQVEITQYGESKAGLEWPQEVCARDAQVFQHVRSHADHITPGEAHQAGGHSIRNLIGWIENPAAGETALLGELHLLEPETWAPKLRAIQKAPAGLAGMSLDALVRCLAIKQGGREIRRVVQIVAAASVDLVSGPAGGGQILRAVASVEDFWKASPNAELDPTAGTKQGNSGGRNMKELIERIMQAIKRFDPARSAAVEAEIAKLEKDEEKLNRVTQVLAEIELPKPAEPAKAAPGLSEEDKKVLADAKASVAAARVMQCQAALRTALSDSKLPVPLAAEVERRFKDREFKAEELAEEIKQVRQAYAQLVPEGRITHPTVRITMQDTDKLQIALDKVCGLTHEVKVEEDAKGFQRITQGAALPADIPGFRGLREAYVAYTGDVDIRGESKVERIIQIFNTAGFPYAFAATLNRLLLKDYAAVNYREREIISSITSPSDFKTQERIRVGYFGDLETVAEDGTYEEIAPYTDEKISYSVFTKGNSWTLTRRAIINDDIGAVKVTVGRAGRSAARTFAQYVWNFFINNSTYDPTGLAWAHGTHGNLGAVALGNPAAAVAEFTVIRKALFNMTEKDSGKKLGLVGPYLLVVPIDLEANAKAWNQAQYLDATFTPNPYYHLFGVNDERIFVNPLMTDASDWGVFDISGNVDLLEIGFLQGRQNPELFLADNPTVGQMFTQDRIQYKIRHEYAGDILDCRGMFKEVVG
jgi:hypothetical protein